MWLVFRPSLLLAMSLWDTEVLAKAAAEVLATSPQSEHEEECEKEEEAGADGEVKS